MDYVYVTKENIEQEHICCAIRSNSDVQFWFHLNLNLVRKIVI
jgi:hypothetical protein